MDLKKNTRPLLVSIVLVTTHGCATKASLKANDPVKPPAHGNVELLKPSFDQAGVQAPLPSPTKKELLKFIIALSAPDYEFMLKDSELLKRIPSPAQNSFEKAALTIGVVRQVTAQALSMSEEESGQGGALEKSSIMIQEALQRHEVDLLDVLSNNIALKQHGIYRLVLEALAYSSDSQAYKDEIRTAIFKEAEQWASLLPQKLISEDLPNEEPDVESAPEQLTPGDLLRGDHILSQAQGFAEDLKFLKAIKKAQQIGQTDPLYPSAQEKIKTYSNNAVQRLRQKAAQSFQNALPIDDQKVKVAFLIEARDFLQEALSNYPDAEQIPTVRENLAVIKQDLEKFQEEGATSEETPEE